MTTDHKPLDITPIKARAEAATPGPWRLCNDGKTISAPNHVHVTSSTFQLRDTGEFIAHARADIPALIAEVERLREGLTKIAETPNVASDMCSVVAKRYLDGGRW